MPSEIVGLVALVLVAVTLMGIFTVGLSSQYFTANEQVQAAGNMLQANSQSAELVATGQINGIYYPGQPGLEANGGHIAYYQSQPYTYNYNTYNNYQVSYTYQYPVDQPSAYTYTTYGNYWSSYTYQVPQNTQHIGYIYMSKPQPQQGFYTQYMWLTTSSSYNVPYLEFVSYQGEQWYYAPAPYLKTSTSSCVVLVGSAGCTFFYTNYYVSSITFYSWDVSYSQNSYPSIYSVPYTKTLYGSYQELVSKTGYQYYTVSISLPYTYTYTTYNNYYTCQSYTYYQNSQGTASYTYTVGVPHTYTYRVPTNTVESGTYYVNKTVIENGQYQVVQVPVTYTYTVTTFQTETGTYYVPTQETGQASVTYSNPNTGSSCYYYSVPVLHSTTAYTTKSNTLYYETWTPEWTTQTYSYLSTAWQFQSFTYYNGGSMNEQFVTLHEPVQKKSQGFCPFGCVPGNNVVWENYPQVYYPYYIFLQTYYQPTPYTEYTPEQVQGTYTYYTTHVYSYPYTYYITSFQTQLGSEAVPYQQSNTQTIYSVVYQPRSGTYWDSSQVNNGATAYNTNSVVIPYTYWNATLSDTSVGSMTVTGIIYENPTIGETYTVPLTSTPTWSPGQWLTSDGWSPPTSWSGWQSWTQSGTYIQALGGYGYQWGGSSGSGLPFVTDGVFIQGEGVVLQPGEWLSVPFAPKYEVGFVTSAGNVWWIS